MRFRAPFGLTGTVTRDDGCPSTSTVQISKRVLGKTAFRPLATVMADETGEWSVPHRSKRSATYEARVLDDGDCLGEAPSTTKVKVRAKVEVRKRGSCGNRKAIRGLVRPNHGGTKVVLQHSRDGAWRKVDDARLTRNSWFTLRSKRCGLHRVVWRSQSPENLRAGTRLRI